MTKVLLYLGTSRHNNYSQHVANFIQKIINQNFPTINSELVSSKKYQINFNDEATSASIL
jgi:hypothetical protein